MCIIFSFNFCPIAALFVDVVNFPGTTRPFPILRGPLTTIIKKNVQTLKMIRIANVVAFGSTSYSVYDLLYISPGNKLTNRKDGVMPERSTISRFITKAQTRAFSVIHLAVFAKLVAAEAEISILQPGVTESRQLALAHTPLRRHLIFGELLRQVASRLPVLEAAKISWRDKEWKEAGQYIIKRGFVISLTSVSVLILRVRSLERYLKKRSLPRKINIRWCVMVL